MSFSSPVSIQAALAGRAVVLLDLNETLAFECDRLDPDQNFAATYDDLGGGHLDPDDVMHLVVDTCDRMRQIGRDPDRYDSFPTIEEVLASEGPGRGLPVLERRMIATVIGLHEVGVIPDSVAESLHRLARRYRLGLVSNMWADSCYSRAAIQDAGVQSCFESLVFSSDHGVTKPSAQIFRIALGEMAAERDAAVYVGNSLRRDVVGATNAGIPSIWISAEPELAAHTVPTAIARDFRSFVEVAI